VEEVMKVTAQVARADKGGYSWRSQPVWACKGSNSEWQGAFSKRLLSVDSLSVAIFVL